jgi:hypothetical protein
VLDCNKRLRISFSLLKSTSARGYSRRRCTSSTIKSSKVELGKLTRCLLKLAKEKCRLLIELKSATYLSAACYALKTLAYI